MYPIRRLDLHTKKGNQMARKQPAPPSEGEVEPLTFAYLFDNQMAKRACELLAREPRVEVVPLGGAGRILRDWIPVFSARGPMPKKNAYARLLDLRKETDLALVRTQGPWLAPAILHVAVWPQAGNEEAWAASILTLPGFARRIRPLRTAA